MKRVAITGSEGTIGTVLRECLADYEVQGIDLPAVDIRRYGDLATALENVDAVVHLAW